MGHIHPLSGFLAFDGGLVTNGLTLAVEEINAGGGIKSMGGARIALTGGDTQGKVEVGMAEAERLIRDGVVAVLGPYQSPVAYAVSQLCEKERTPFVITVAVADNITERGFEYTFRVQPNARVMTERSLDHLADLAKATDTGVKTLSMLHEDGLFGYVDRGSRRASRQEARDGARAEGAVQLPHARPHDRGHEDQGGEGGRRDRQRVLRRRAADRPDRDRAPTRGPGRDGDLQWRLLESEVSRRPAAAGGPDPGRQLLAQPAQRAGEAGDGGLPEALQRAHVLALGPGRTAR